MMHYAEIVEEGLKTANTKHAFQVVKKLRKTFTLKQHNIQNEKGRLLTDLHDILDRWKTYTGKLYMDESKDDADTSVEESSTNPCRRS